MLLKAGCDIEIPDKEGYTGSKLASGEPWDDILDVMTALAENNQWAELVRAQPRVFPPRSRIFTCFLHIPEFIFHVSRVLYGFSTGGRILTCFPHQTP